MPLRCLVSRRVWPASAFVFATAFFVLAPTLPAQTADGIIDAYINARGGSAKIKSVQTERVTATITLQPGVEGTLIYERKRPLKMHMEIITGGRSFLRIYDGKSSGWIYNPFVANPVVEPMSPADIPGIAQESDLDGPFVDYKAKGNQIEFVGMEDFEGMKAPRLKLTSKLGEVSFFLFNPSTGLILKWEGMRKVKDRTTGKDVDVPWQNLFSDFREVDGLKYPFLVESGAADGSQSQKIATSKIEINIPLNDSEFSEPKPPAPPPGPPPSK